MKQVLKKATAIGILAVLAMTMLVGCMTHEHIVGTGAATGYTESTKQWYLLWGMVPLNSVDTKALSGAAQNYKIVTETSLVDAVLSGLGFIVSVRVRTVKVIK
ncbi:MAG: hypothetical protein KAU31_13500 [Spirochaetaceae bacterium]|nr:hypothetical protein [Spirochaetaceae bacterium]